MLKFLLVIAIFALVTYLTVRALQRRGAVTGRGGERPSGRPQPPRRPQPRPKPVAPDDDEDFLRDLDRKRLHGDDPDTTQ